MRKISEKIIATCGNNGLYPAGLDVFDDEGHVLVPPNTLAIWDVVTKKSLGPAITVASNERIVISVGIDEWSMRSSFNDMIYGNSIQAATAEASKCGVPQIVDLFYDCVNCGDDYTVNVTVDNNTVKNQFPYNKKATYSASVSLDCCACDSCPSGIDARALSCALKDSFDEKRAPLTKRSTHIPSRNNVYPKGFTTHILYGGDTPLALTTKVFCINTVKDVCTGDCIHANTALTNISFTDITLPVPALVNVPLTFTVDPANPTMTFLYQLTSVANQITKALKGNGSAVITKGFGKCCPYRLEVNTCFADFAITGQVPCEEYNPFTTPITLDPACKDCGPTPTKAFTQGLRFIADPVEFTCKCTPNLNPIYDKGNKIEVFPAKGFACGQWAVREVQKGALPENLGYDWIMRDYMSDNGGMGRGHDGYEWTNYGAAGYPLDRGRSGGIGRCVSCAGTYCSYVLEHSIPHNDVTVHGHAHATRGRTIVLIPSEDAITRAEFETAINSYITSSGSPMKQSILCSVDQDQIEAPVRYPDANGYINV